MIRRTRPLPLLAVLVAGIATAAADAVPRLSAEAPTADIASTKGSGDFGSWRVDGFGLPAYRYAIDQTTDPIAPQDELAGRIDAWHQVGNDRIVANAFNHGNVTLWSQDRVYQWVNLVDDDAGHHGGGFGYLVANGEVTSTLWLDRPPGAVTERDFGVCYARRLLETGDIAIEEWVYAPFGDDPLLLHDVKITNRTSEPLEASWFEYWDVHPVLQLSQQIPRGMLPPEHDPATNTLRVTHAPSDLDVRPLTIFAAPVGAPASGFDTDARVFFGDGTRERPEGAALDRTTGSVAPPAAPGLGGQTAFVYRSPVSLAAGESVTLRFAYGIAHAAEIPTLVAKYAAASDPLGETAAAWKAWLPKASFPTDDPWLARELQWDAYVVRSGATFEEECGHHILSQGGYYQYDSGLQISVRDPLQHMLPMIYADPGLAREVLRYSARLQPIGTGILPYGVASLCTRVDMGTSNDLDFWFLLSIVEYVTATRDFAFLEEIVPYADLGEAPIWDHVKLAHMHQETLIGRGPHGVYVTGLTGDWSDFSTQFLQMTESTLVAAQLAYVYPRLAGVAERIGDDAFAAALREDASELQAVLDAEWTGLGWYSRGYSGARQIGEGVIFLEPQPWAILAGAPEPGQPRTLVGNIRRFLTGIDAPPELNGPAKIGSAQSPANRDPDVTERNLWPPFGDDNQPGVGGLTSGSNNAVWVGGVWYALNGPLAWSLGTLDEVLPEAGAWAWNELERNTLTAHTEAFPYKWDGLLLVDDVCHTFYQSDPSDCGTGLTTAYNTQILHQPAWSLFATLRLLGIEPVTDGYEIAPRAPFDEFSLRLPKVGIEATDGRYRGYIVPERDDRIALRVRLPEGVDASTASAFVDGAPAPSTAEGRHVRFEVPATAGEPADWAVTW